MADMRGRRPDGVATEGGKTEGEAPLMGKAANAEQDRVEVRNQPPFPAGLKALEGRDPTSKVTLINLQLGGGRYTVVDWSRPEKKGGGRPTRIVVTGPFQAFEVRVSDAERLLKLYGPDILKGRTEEEVAPKVKLVVAPPKGDCGGKMTFHVPALGQVFPDGSTSGLDIKTCPFAGCPHHSADPKPWSIWQAQFFIQKTRSPSAIEDFINAIDARHDVLFFGTQMAALRRRRKLDRMGIGRTTGGKVF